MRDKLSVTVLRSAEQDIEKLLVYYAMHYPSAVFTLEKELSRVFEQLSIFPESYQLASPHIRRAPLLRLHQNVYYTYDQTNVLIVNVLAQKLNPKTITSRLLKTVY